MFSFSICEHTRPPRRMAMLLPLLLPLVVSSGACAGTAVAAQAGTARDPLPQELPALADTTLRRLRALIPVGVTATDSGAFIIGVVAGGRTSTLLEAAHVALYPRGSGAPLGIATDDRGRFVLGPVAPGSYRLRLQQIGYERVWHDLELRARVIDTICANLPEQYKRLIGDCITAEGLVRCPEVAPDSAALGRPNVRCS